MYPSTVFSRVYREELQEERDRKNVAFFDIRFRFGLEYPWRWDSWEHHTGSAVCHHTGHAERERQRDRNESAEFTKQITTFLLRYSVYDVAAADVWRRDCKNVAGKIQFIICYIFLFLFHVDVK